MEFVRRAATRFASRAAVSTTESDGWATYAALVKNAETTHARLGAAAALGASSSSSPILVSTPAGNSARVGPRVAVWAQPGPEFVTAAFACYMRGACVVPLSPLTPRAELARVLEDSGASAVLAPGRALSAATGDDDNTDAVRLLLQDLSAAQKVPLIAVEDVERTAAAAASSDGSDQQEEQRPPDETNSNDNNNGDGGDGSAAALILYTSGSTGRPKGVVYSAQGLLHQADGLARAWRVTGGDRVLHALPLHHVHGLVNALHCPLGSGARVRFVLPRFSAAGLWAALAAEAEKEAGAAAAAASSPSSRLVFHGVPTMYSMLLEELAKRRRGQGGPSPGSELADAWARGARGGARLFVCGSAACPPSLAAAWRAETGHSPLERYGMTEAGMILSNPYDASDLRTDKAVVEALAPAPKEETEEEGRAAAAATLAHDAALVRRPGCVGLPLPGVEVRLVPVPVPSAAGDGELAANGLASAAGRELTIPEALALEEKARRRTKKDDGQRQEAAGGDDGGDASSSSSSSSGRPPEAFYDLRARGPGLFAGYWRRPDATAEAFAGAGAAGEGGGAAFFETGDVVAFDNGGSSGQGGEGGVRYLRIVGRASADVIKPRGFKVSGLDVEAALLELRAAAAAAASPGGGGGGGNSGGAADTAAAPTSPSSGPALVAECAVFGVPDGRYEGEEVVAALVRLASSTEKEEADDGDDEASAEKHAAQLARGAAALLPPYALPRVWRFLKTPIPRNAMGKVNKRALRAALFPPGATTPCEARWVGKGELV